METELVPTPPQIDKPFENAQNSLRNGESGRPQQYDSAARLENAAELREDGIDLRVREVFHHADVPDSVERIALERKREDVAADFHVHHGMAPLEHRTH